MNRRQGLSRPAKSSHRIEIIFHHDDLRLTRAERIARGCSCGDWKPEGRAAGRGNSPLTRPAARSA